MSAPPLATQTVPDDVDDKDPYPDEQDIHKTLQDIRAREISVGRSPFFLFRYRPFRTTYLYIELVITDVLKYIYWVIVTWTAAISRTWTFLLSKHESYPPGSEESDMDHFADWLSYMFFVIGGTLVLPFFLVLCLVARFPPITRMYYYWSRLFGGNLGLINSGNPNLFKAITVRQAQAAKIELSKSISESNDTDDTRHFNYDISKLLLQISAVIFEHDSNAIREAAFGGSNSSGVGYEFLEATGDASIRRFCRQFGIEYHAVSELNDKSTAFCAVFWDPRSSWIIVALKGTGPTEFGDWVGNFDAIMVPCGDYIDGFSLVHRGFKNHVFPDNGRRPWESDDRRPYNTISQSVKALGKHLQQGLEVGQKVNVWFTGMSLGSSTASLIYSRMLMKPEEIGTNAILRDAYLFGVPILCDRQSVTAFNKRMFAEGAPRRSMWRITSNHDFVATGLPEFGDHLHILDPGALDRPTTNYLLYAHLGTEIVLYDYPFSSSAAGNHIKHNINVKIASNHFSREEIVESNRKNRSQLGERIREQIGVALQQIPLLGRFIAHSTVYYWDQLDRVALGTCEWTIY